MGKIIDKLALVYLKDGMILSTRSKGKDTYYIPGGKREEGETDEDALTREIREELGVDLIRSTIKFLGAFEAQAHGKQEGVVVRMTCYTGDFQGELTPMTEIAEIVWLTHSGREQSSAVDKIIFDWLKERSLLR